MPVELKRDRTAQGDIFPNLNDGQLAEILFSTTARDIGKVGQRMGDNFVLIGQDEDEIYEIPDDSDLRLRVLEDGEVIIVTDN